MKRLLLLLFIGLVANVANAQSLNYGIKGGLNVSTLADESYSGRLGWNVGVVANYDFNSKYGIEADLIYSKQRARTGIYVLEAEEKEYDLNESSHYLQLPLTFKYYLIDKFYAEGGFQLGYLLKKKWRCEIFDDELEDNDEETSDVTDGSHRFEVGIVGGVGYVFNNNLFVNARYVYGLSHTYKNNIVCEDARLRTFQFSVGYCF